jgi:hypothetical protein
VARGHHRPRRGGSRGGAAAEGCPDGLQGCALHKRVQLGGEGFDAGTDLVVAAEHGAAVDMSGAASSTQAPLAVLRRRLDRRRDGAHGEHLRRL